MPREDYQPFRNDAVLRSGSAGSRTSLRPSRVLPTYDNISNDITGAGFSGNGQIGYPLPAVCRRGQLD